MRLEEKKWESKLLLQRTITARMGYNPYRDYISALILSSLIRTDEWRALPKISRASVVGPYYFNQEVRDFVIVADSALNFYEGRYDMLVTDLDGPIDRILEDESSVKVVHAHGDNIPYLLEYVPKLKGKLLGTTQSIPFRHIRNIGGFTDGDRSILMAALMGAEEIDVYGFNFDEPVETVKTKKRAKLELAKEIIDKISNIKITYY